MSRGPTVPVEERESSSVPLLSSGTPRPTRYLLPTLVSVSALSGPSSDRVSSEKSPLLETMPKLMIFDRFGS